MSKIITNNYLPTKGWLLFCNVTVTYLPTLKQIFTAFTAIAMTKHR